MSDLREQVARAISAYYWDHDGRGRRDNAVADHAAEWLPVADAVLAVFAEREREQSVLDAGANAKRYDDGYEDGREAAVRELRARIEALPRHTPVERYGNGVEMRRRDLGGWVRRRDVLAVFDD